MKAESLFPLGPRVALRHPVLRLRWVMLVWSLMSAWKTSEHKCSRVNQEEEMWQSSRQLCLFVRGLTRATGLPFWGDPRDSKPGHALVAACPCWQCDIQRDAAPAPDIRHNAMSRNDVGGKQSV